MSDASPTQNTQIDEILEKNDQKQASKPKKIINSSEVLLLNKYLRQNKDIITQQNYQEVAYILTKLPIFEYVYSIKGIQFITEFLKTGKLLEINENDYTIFENKPNYKQRFFLLIKGSVAFEGTIKKNNKQDILSKYSLKQFEMQSQVFLTSNYNDNNQNKIEQKNDVKRLNSQESEYDIDFDDTKSALFRLDTKNSDTDYDDDCISISSFGTASKKSLSPRQQQNHEAFLPSKFNGQKLQVNKNSTFNQKRRKSNYLHSSEIKVREQVIENQSNHFSNQENQISENDQDFKNQIGNNYVIQVNKPNDSTPQNFSERNDQSHISRKSSQNNLDFQQNEQQVSSLQQFLNLNSDKKIQSQRVIQIPSSERQNKIRSISQASKRRDSNVTSFSQNQSKFSNSGSNDIQSSQIDSQRSQNQKYGNHLFVQNKQKSCQSSIMKKRSSLINSLKQSNNNSINSSQVLNEHQNSQKSLFKGPNRSKSSQKKQKKTQQIQLIEKFKTLNAVGTFGHKLKYGRFKIHRIVTSSDKCALISFDMKDFQDLIYGLDESDPKIKQIQSIINKQHLFKGCSFRQINNLTLKSRKIQPFKNEIIYNQNDKSKGLYFILKGEVKILIDAIEDFIDNQQTLLKNQPNSKKTLVSFYKQDRASNKSISIPISGFQQQEESQPHELFIHKNKNKFQSSQLKFNEQHRKEVGILNEGNFFGLEDLVLGQARSCTIQVNGKEAEILYIPLDSTDIFTYLDDEEKNNIILNAEETIVQRKARAICNTSYLSNNQLSNSQVVGVNQIPNDLNCSKYAQTQQNFNRQVKQENTSFANNCNKTNRSLSPATQQSPYKQNQNMCISEEALQFNSKSNAAFKENNNSNIQIPARFSKAAKIDDMIQRYPNQQSRVTPKKQQIEVMINNMFLANDQTTSDQNKSIQTMNSQKQNTVKNLQINQLLKTNISLIVAGNTLNNLQSTQQEYNEQVTQQTQYLDKDQIYDLQNKKVSNKQDQDDQTAEELIDNQDKMNDLIQYYNQKQIQDAKSLKMKRRSLSCFFEGENANDSTNQNDKIDKQDCNKLKQATTLDPNDIKNENIIWKKDIIMSNTEYNHLKIQLPSQTSINQQKTHTEQSSKFSGNLITNMNQRDIQINQQDNNETVSFSNNLINSNLSVKYSNPVSIQKKLDDSLKYPNKKIDLVSNLQLNTKQKSGIPLADEKLNSITNQYIQLKLPIKNSKQKSRQDLEQTPSVNYISQKSNYRYQQKDKAKSLQSQSNPITVKSQDQGLSQKIPQYGNQVNENVCQIRTALSTAQKAQRNLNTSGSNRMSAPNERSFRIQQNKLKNQESQIKQNQENINNQSMFEQNSLEFRNKQERSYSSQGHARVKVLSRSQNRQIENQQLNQMNQSQTVKAINLNETQIINHSRNQSRLSPNQRESSFEKKYNTENFRNLKQMNTTVQSYLTMKNIDSYNMNISQMSTSLSKRPNTKGSSTRKKQQGFSTNNNQHISVNDKSLSEMKMKQELENIIINPSFKISNNFHFINSYLQEEEGILEGHENIQNQIDAKKNILSHLQQFSNKASSGKDIQQSEFRKSYVQKYIYPEDEFAREADQKIKLQLSKLEEGKDQNPYLQNTKFENNSQTSLMLFYNYIRRKLKHVHKNEILYSRDTTKANSQDQKRSFQVQNSTAVKNNLRKHKKFFKRKNQIQELEQYANQSLLYNYNTEQQYFLEQNINQEQLINKTISELPFDIYIEKNNELGQINEKFSKNQNEGQQKTQSEIKQRQKEILTQIKTQNQTIKKNGSLPITPIPQYS
ncbi:cyclic nucleotide-binding domain protein (macronuclear) [Tetrahymena thermophila SB210]|uniref:Cyclic nucleotide-binding domain protein n=1 Tax=Tetrahymena thermophila (strain SB210) TaxID=312017 RepID=I7MIB8_TETTS|nr:cyclic nucleotide-binding domain protein [Tetrahymena thermophila SB210]EAS04263.1 cyclic nucleotide-binding domain protein [Tetrahymena thermophila SB210]|eukprot:XP_001024508.1 cyclic nucleotide-binding domain protein [Tetrahymena thermophila SB210]